MSEQNKNQKLGLGVGKLGLANLKIDPNKIKQNNNMSTEKGKVIVVSKGKASERFSKKIDDSNSLTDQERERRMQVLRDANNNPNQSSKNLASLTTKLYRNRRNEQLMGESGAVDINNSTQKEERIKEDSNTIDLNLQGQATNTEERKSNTYNNEGSSKKEGNNFKKDGKYSKPNEQGKAATGGGGTINNHPVANENERPLKKKKDNYIKNQDMFESRAGASKKNTIDGGVKKLNNKPIDLHTLSEESYLDNFERVRSFKRKDRSKSRDQKNHLARERVIREVEIPDFISVQDLASRMAEKSSTIIKVLFEMGNMVTLNQSVDADTAELVVVAFGHKPKRITEAEIEFNLLNRQQSIGDSLQLRPPVVTIMGHVDHGKTSLLDALRLTDVAAGEAGGITQHIGAYQVTLQDGRKITFLDTPGHEAFTAMRARGAKITDIVVLVVAADDGVMAQTIEAINHAKAAEVPIIIAINKIDKVGANSERVKTELLMHNITVESMGGDIVAVEVSARTKQGLALLEEMILLQADILELKADFGVAAEGSVIESKMEKSRGPVATLLVQQGTLQVGAIIVAGTSWGKIRSIFDDKGKIVKHATPSMPVEILGLESAPTAGDTFIVTDSERRAKEIVNLRLERERNKKFVRNARVSLEQMFLNTEAGAMKELNIIIKGDVQGSIEAICSALEKLGNEEVRIKVMHHAVGNITESDVALAATCSGVIIAFNVSASSQAKEAALQKGVEIRHYSIIYNILDELNTTMSGMLAPIIKEEYLGTAEIKQVFDITKVGKVAGCYVLQGVIKRRAEVRIIRNNTIVYKGKLDSLKRSKEEVKEVRHNFECGMTFKGYSDMKIGDKIECYEITEENRVL